MASICKIRGSCSSRNRLHLQLGWPLLVIACCLLASTSCSAQPIESTTMPPNVEEGTTLLPVLLEESSSTPESTIQNVTTTTPAQIIEDAIVEQAISSDTVEATDNFVSVYGGNLEQDIKNDVNSEVEDAPSPVEPIIEDVQKAAEAVLENQGSEAAVQTAREPKTLDAEEKNKPIQDEESESEDQAEPEAVTDNIAVSSEQVESRSRPLPSVTSDLVSVILNEDRAITEQPITKTNLLALEQEHEVFEGEDSTPEPIYEEPKHQVTKKQGVVDPLPIEVAPEVAEEPEIDQVAPEVAEDSKTVRVDRKFKEPNDNQNDIDDNTIEGDEAPIKTSTTAAPLVNAEPTKSVPELKAEIEKEAETEDKAEVEAEVEGNTTSEETVVEAVDPNDARPEEEAATEVARIGEEELKEEPLEQQADQKEPTATKVAKTSFEQPKEEEVADQQIDQKATTNQESSEPNSTEKPLKVEGSLNVDGESVEEQESLESEEKPTERTEIDDHSSEEEKEEPVGAEVKSSSDDSTATPLVSYPPHDAGQTFDSNSADEHSAQLSGPSNYRSSLIIALCSGTAVIFIVASLVIFVVSFQRQHGTLDIEMQEQRLGKDVQDEDNAQMKLLDVDLSSPVIVPMGNEETDECL
ncbi:FK506-binding protein 5 [Drosophila elegans]|uniref:FK506-binding protein 5 n=1 Tax=Drosophila elegans TaxID=30023 RepID=UPI0007E82BC3|nr:FK506-binding protein 5 [Drosophila elegans]